MATSSIFTTPQFNTEESVRSLLSAIEASEKVREDLARRLDTIDVHEISNPQQIADALKKVQ